MKTLIVGILGAVVGAIVVILIIGYLIKANLPTTPTVKAPPPGTAQKPIDSDKVAKKCEQALKDAEEAGNKSALCGLVSIVIDVSCLGYQFDYVRKVGIAEGACSILVE